MTAWLRWQLASPIIVLSALFLALTAAGGYAYWSVDSTAWRVLTAFMCLMYAICLGIGISIAVGRKLDSFPWRRMVTAGLFIVLSLGVHWVRGMV